MTMSVANASARQFYCTENVVLVSEGGTPQQKVAGIMVNAGLAKDLVSSANSAGAALLELNGLRANVAIMEDKIVKLSRPRLALPTDMYPMTWANVFQRIREIEKESRGSVNATKLVKALLDELREARRDVVRRDELAAANVGNERLREKLDKVGGRSSEIEALKEQVAKLGEMYDERGREIERLKSDLSAATSTISQYQEQLGEAERRLVSAVEAFAARPAAIVAGTIRIGLEKLSEAVKARQ